MLVKKLLKERENILSIISTTIIGVISSFLMTLAFANLLEPKSLGLYQYLISTTSIIGALSMTGLGIAVVRAVGKKDYFFLAQAKRYYIYGFFPPILTAGIFACYYIYKGNLLIAVSVFISVIALMASFYNSRFNALYVGLERLRESNYLLKTIAFSPIIFVLPSLFFIDNPGILAILYFTGIFLSVFTVSRFLKMAETESKLVQEAATKKDSDAMTQKYFSFSIHQSLNSIVGSIGVHSDKIIIFQLLGPEQTAIYYIATSLPNRVRSVIKQFEPFIITKFVKFSPMHIRSKMLERITISLVLVIPIIVFYILLSPLFYTYFFPLYPEAVAYTQLYSLCFAAVAIGSLSQSALKAHGKNSSFYLHTVLYTIFRVGSLTIGAYFFSLLGAIVALVISLTFGNLLYIFLFNKDAKK